MSWTVHVAGERAGTVQACRLCGHVLQDITPPPGLILPAAELEALVRDVPWWGVGGRVAVDGDASLDLDQLLEETQLALRPCTPQAAP